MYALLIGVAAASSAWKKFTKVDEKEVKVVYTTEIKNYKLNALDLMKMKARKVQMKNKHTQKTKLTHLKALLLAFVIMFSALAPSIPMEAATKKVSISKEAVTMGIKETYQLKMKNTTKKVKWSSSNKSVATVNNKGVVTAKKKGTATITAKVSDKKYTCKVTVKKTSISKTKVNVGVNDTYQLKINNTVSKVKWSTSDKKIATVNKRGVVTGKKAGTCTIKATVNGKTYKCKVTTKKVSLSNTKLAIGEYDTYQLKVKNASSKVKWSTSDKKIATVDSKGVVTAKKAGTCTIKATVNKKVYKCKLTVKEVYIATEIDKKENSYKKRSKMTAEVGDVVFFKLENYDSENIEWKSSNEKIAEVLTGSRVYLKKSGTATISTTVNGKTYSCKLTVKKSNIPEMVTVYIDYYYDKKGYEKTHVFTMEQEVAEGEKCNSDDWSMAFYDDTFEIISEDFVAKEGVHAELYKHTIGDGSGETVDIEIMIDVYDADMNFLGVETIKDSVPRGAKIQPKDWLDGETYEKEDDDSDDIYIKLDGKEYIVSSNADCYQDPAEEGDRHIVGLYECKK